MYNVYGNAQVVQNFLLSTYHSSKEEEQQQQEKTCFSIITKNYSLRLLQNE